MKKKSNSQLQRLAPAKGRRGKTKQIQQEAGANQNQRIVSK